MVVKGVVGTGKRKSRRRGRKSMKGKGFKDILKKGLSFVKDNKLISRGLKTIGGMLPGQYGVAAQGLASTADSLGYGRRRMGRGAPLKF